MVKEMGYRELLKTNPNNIPPNFNKLIEDAKEQITIALSLGPSVEDLNNNPVEVRKETELEMVLMQLKNIATNYVKDQKEKRKKHNWWQCF
jgi:hypothetical protein